MNRMVEERDARRIIRRIRRKRKKQNIFSMHSIIIITYCDGDGDVILLCNACIFSMEYFF